MEVDVLLTGDSKNLVSMSGTASHDLSPQLSNLWIYRLDVSSPWQLRTYEEAMLDAHAVGGGTCPGCADIPESEERVEREHARRQQMASDAAKTTAMLAHRGYWLRRSSPSTLTTPLPAGRGCASCTTSQRHNVTDTCSSAIWSDVDTLSAEPWAVKFDLLNMLCDMGVTTFRPNPKSRDDRSCSRPAPELRGGDISILRTDIGMLAILQLVYPVAAQLADAPDASAPPALDAREDEMAARARERRAAHAPAGAASREHIAERAEAAVRHKLELVCKTVVALFDMHQVYQDATYTHTADAHALRFEAAWARFEVAARAMTSNRPTRSSRTTSRRGGTCSRRSSGGGARRSPTSTSRCRSAWSRSQVGLRGCDQPRDQHAAARQCARSRPGARSPSRRGRPPPRRCSAGSSTAGAR
jgi:hypothetical protein